MVASGTYLFNPTTAELALDAFSRIGLRGPAVTADHMRDLKVSANLILQDWGNRGVNLWAVDLQTIPLVQGVGAYTLPANTIMMLDAYVTIYPLGAPQSVAPNFTTVLSSFTVTVGLTAHGLSVGNWVSIIIPVSIGGIVLLGFYQVVSVPNGNSFTITAAAAATSGVSGGAVPVFTTVLNSTSVNVLLPNHGLLAGQAFNVQVATVVGQITVSGSYPVATVVNANNFTITIPVAAGANGTVAENTALAQIAGQSATADPVDRYLNPISRTDYAAQPDKVVQAVPTTYWFERLAAPIVTLWQVPNANGPYALNYYRMRQLQDFAASVGQTLDTVPRFLRAFTMELAADLYMKYPPPPERGIKLSDLQMAAKELWKEAGGEDRERVPLKLRPNFSAYTR